MPPTEPKERKREPRLGEGRPQKPMDLAVIERAASIGCTPEEIATVCQVSRATFHSRVASDPALAEAVERGRDQGRSTLRRLQWQAAQKGNPTMLIWLGKQMLGQRDRHELSGPDGGAIPTSLTIAFIKPNAKPAD
jgi:hypothetical protein